MTCEELVEAFKEIVREADGPRVPQDPGEQLDLAIDAVFSSWNSDRAVLYRRQERIPARPGHGGERGGDGVRQHRRGLRHRGVLHPGPRHRARRASTGTTCRTRRARTSSRGSATRVPLADAGEDRQGAPTTSCCEIMALLEDALPGPVRHRVHHRARHAVDAADPDREADGSRGVPHRHPAGGRGADRRTTRRWRGSPVAQLAQLMFPRFDTAGLGAEKAQVLGRGMAASPGAAVGKAVFDSYTAVKWQRSGEKVILVRRETNPDDLDGMIAAQGILTSRGGKTSPRRGRGAGDGQDLRVRCGGARRRHQAPPADRARTATMVARGRRPLRRRVVRAWCTLGEVPVVAFTRWWSTSRARWIPTGPGRRAWCAAVHRIMGHADDVRRLRVRANADTVEDAERARRFGARGDRVVPHRAHVPRRAPPARRAADPGRGRRGAGQRPGGAAAAAARATSPAAARP